MQMPFKDPQKAANAGYKAVIDRVMDHGYWPFAKAAELDGAMPGWGIIISIKNPNPARPSDKEAYVFEFRVQDKIVAYQAVKFLHGMFLDFTKHERKEGRVRGKGAEHIAKIMKEGKGKRNYAQK